jgi:Spy/CpxP family protein refolding chaperone
LFYGFSGFAALEKGRHKPQVAGEGKARKEAYMKKWYSACLALALIITAAPAIAQETDLDDENMIFLVADMGNQEPSTMARTGQDQSPPTPGARGPGGGDHRYMDHHPGWGGGAGFLNLTQDQLSKMQDLHNRYYRETRNLRYDLMQRRLEMRRLFLDPKTDSAALLAKQRELSAVRQRLMDAMARMMIDWRAILTPEQVQKLDMASLARGMMPQHGHMMGHGRIQGDCARAGCMIEDCTPAGRGPMVDGR